MGRVPWSVKWLLAPAALAGLGYGVVGPRLAGTPAKAIEGAIERVRPAPRATPPEPAPEQSVPASQPDAPAPKVTVGVRPVDETTPVAPTDETPRPRRRRRRHRAAPETTEPASSTGPDPASTPGP